MLSGSFDEDDHSHLAPEAEEAPVTAEGAGRPPKLRKTATIVMEENTAIGMLKRAVELRSKYQHAAGVSEALQNAVSAGTPISFSFDVSGLLQLTNATEGTLLSKCGENVGTFAADYTALIKIVSNGHCRTFCHQRLEMLQQRFELHETMQGDLEMREMGRGQMASVDFFKVGKVDNHIHLAAAFHAPRFSEYVKTKLVTEAETIVAVDGGVNKSLSQLFAEAGLDESCLGLDAFHILGECPSELLDTDRAKRLHSPRLSSPRLSFPASSRSRPLAVPALRPFQRPLQPLAQGSHAHHLPQEVPHFDLQTRPVLSCPVLSDSPSYQCDPCVRSSNAIDGRYFGELTRALLDRAERKFSKYQTTMELRISVYGIDGGEWARLAKWVLTPWQGAEDQPPR